MALVKVKPTSAGPPCAGQGRQPRPAQGQARSRPLVEAQKRGSGRNNNGHITTRHKGGGHKQHYRIVDFKRDKDGIPAKVERLEYDPNRSANLALLCYADGERRYIIAPARRRGGRAADERRAKRRSSRATRCRCATSRSARRSTASRCCRARVRRWRARPARRCSCWRAKASMRSCACARARSARCTSTAARRSAKSATRSTACARSARRVRKRWRGIRPTVRGVAMNPVDHPHGGGEGTQRRPASGQSRGARRPRATGRARNKRTRRHDRAPPHTAIKG